ncbi:MAG: hypothetical protein V7637_1150 [Mycobacteriales bacterium]|jgi:branched-chain amino acid transport system permease protein
MVFIGGVSSRTGAVVITVLPYLLQNKLPGVLTGLGIDSGWYQTNASNVNAGLFSLMFLLVVLVEPGGIHALLRKLEGRLRTRAGRGGRPAGNV